MRVKNTTSLDNKLIRDVVRFVRPPGLRRFDVNVRNLSYGAIAGRAYYAGSGYHDRACHFVVCRVGVGHWPCLRNPGKGHGRAWHGKPQWLASKTEALVFIMAHELRHLWQARVPKGRRAWGSRGQFSEVDCDAYALRMLRAWRRAHP